MRNENIIDGLNYFGGIDNADLLKGETADSSQIEVSLVDFESLQAVTRDAAAEHNAGFGFGTNQQANGGLPPEVSVLTGTNGDDVLVMDAAMYETLNSGSSNFSNYVTAFGGDDLIIRDQTGDYALEGGAFSSIEINGGSGEDTVSYSALSSGLVANLDLLGWVNQQLPADAPGGAIPHAGDQLFNVENLIGTMHDDVIIGDDGANKFWGLGGNDEIDGNGGSDTIWGGEGNDEIDGGSGNDTLHGEDGNDTIEGGSGTDTIYGGDGNDTIDGGYQSDTIYGGDGSDTIEGGRGHDSIEGGDGSDTIDGGKGNDTISTGDGHDTVDGGNGHDTIHVSGFGDNTIDGGWGHDTIVFGNSATFVNLYTGQAERGTDEDTINSIESVETGFGMDTVFGSNSGNTLETGGGADYVSGLGGNDTINSGSGSDEVYGDSGNDAIDAGSGDDEVSGGTGDDTIQGGSGEDRIRGGEGVDALYGGANADTFVWSSGDLGLDQIKDFNIAEDKFSFDEGFFAEAPGGGVDLAASLVVWDYGPDAAIIANTAADGWQGIAMIENVSSIALTQKIANGSILDVELTGVGGDGPGGFGVIDGPDLDAGLEWLV